MASEQTATQDETVREILAASKRKGSVPLRTSFLQRPRTSGKERAATLSPIVSSGRESAFDQYLLLLAWASGDGHDVRRDSRVWARAIGAPADPSGRQKVSRNWAFLEKQGLVKRERSGRLARVTLLNEDGQGTPYERPQRERYIKIPFAYWEDGYYRELKLPGKAMLLIGLQLLDNFSLPDEKGPEWYGLSPSTLNRGITELKHAGVLTTRSVKKASGLAPEGWTMHRYCTLGGPFGPKGKNAKGIPEELLV